MSNLVPAFFQLLSEMEAKQTSSGIIFVTCNNLSKDDLEVLKNHFEQEPPAAVTHYNYDKTKNILGVLLEEQKLGTTHFHALRVKDYLREKQLLAGSVAIASFPENARTTPQMLLKMLQNLEQQKSQGEIHIFDPVSGGSEKDPTSILLVNPDQTVNDFLTIYLKRKGYQVIVASDGVEGMQKYEESMPDLVITDLNLPVMSGYQLMERIKHAESDRESKIVILTDKRLEEDVQKSFALGASDYITKPFSPVELEARVKRLIS